MNYSLEDMHMKGYKVLHPAVSFVESVTAVAQAVFVVLVLHWAWMTATESHAFFLLVLNVAVLVGLYKSLN